MLQKLKDVGNSVGKGVANVGSAIGDGLESAGDAVDNVAGSVGGALSNPTMLAMLLSGAGAAAAGGYVESRKKHEGETPEERRSRILRNALLFGGGGAAAAGLGSAAIGSLGDALPARDADPASSVIKPTLRVLGAGSTGAALYGRGVKAEQRVRDRLLEAYVNAAERGGYSNIDSLKQLVATRSDNSLKNKHFFDLVEAWRAQNAGGTIAAGNPLNVFENAANRLHAGVLPDDSLRSHGSRFINRLLGHIDHSGPGGGLSRATRYAPAALSALAILGGAAAPELIQGTTHLAGRAIGL